MHRTPLDNASLSDPRIPLEWEPAIPVSTGDCYPPTFLLGQTGNLTPSVTATGVRIKNGANRRCACRRPPANFWNPYRGKDKDKTRDID